jgi:hypothetical protein
MNKVLLLLLLVARPLAQLICGGSPLPLPSSCPLLRFTLSVKWNPSTGQISPQSDDSGRTVYHVRLKGDGARFQKLDVTGVVLSQGGMEAVRSLSNVKVLIINGDASASETILFKTLYVPSSHPRAQRV